MKFSKNFIFTGRFSRGYYLLFFLTMYKPQNKDMSEVKTNLQLDGQTQNRHGRVDNHAFTKNKPAFCLPHDTQRDCYFQLII